MENSIDGSPAGAPFARDDFSDATPISEITYSFNSPIFDIRELRIWNNAGGGLSDGQSIGSIETINFRDADGNIVHTETNVTLPGNGDPFICLLYTSPSPRD